MSHRLSSLRNRRSPQSAAVQKSSQPWKGAWGGWLGLLTAIVLAVQLSGLAEDKDPNFWLEEVTGEKPLAWVKERNVESTSELTKGAEFKELSCLHRSMTSGNSNNPANNTKHNPNYRPLRI